MMMSEFSMFGFRHARRFTTITVIKLTRLKYKKECALKKKNRTKRQ